MALVELYLRERARDGVPQWIRLDLDGTDDPVHGEQDGAAYHAYYCQHIYHPLVIYDSDTSQLILAVLRPGNIHASRGILKRLVRAIRGRWSEVAI